MADEPYERNQIRRVEDFHEELESETEGSVTLYEAAREWVRRYAEVARKNSVRDGDQGEDEG